MRRAMALAVALALGAAAPAFAAPCDSSVSKQPGPTGYVLRQDDTRCEGLFVSPVGAPPVEIVSVTQGDPQFDTAAIDRVQVSLAIDDPPQPVFLRVVGVPANVFYRLDAQITPGRSLAWPLRDVVRPNNLTRDKLGLFAFHETADGDILYLPVRVTPATPAPASGTRVHVVLRSSVDLNRPEWRFLAPGVPDDGFRELPRRGTRLFADLPQATHGTGTFEVRWRNGSGTVQTREFEVAF